MAVDDLLIVIQTEVLQQRSLIEGSWWMKWRNLNKGVVATSRNEHSSLEVVGHPLETILLNSNFDFVV